MQMSPGSCWRCLPPGTTRTRRTQTIAEPARATSDGIRQRIEAALAKTTSLDEDRILRTLLNLMLATLRTNFFSQAPTASRSTRSA